MNATVITTGPGVIIATATASRNCRSVSQWNSFTTPPCRKGTIARPLPNTNAPASAKYQAICQSVSVGAGPWRPVSEQRHRARASAVGAARRLARLRDQRDDAAEHEQPDDLGLGPRGHHRAHDEDAPTAAGRRRASSHELVGAARDDGDDRRADAVERALHPGQARRSAR